jgi:hypothetical protein
MDPACPEQRSGYNRGVGACNDLVRNCPHRVCSDIGTHRSACIMARTRAPVRAITNIPRRPQIIPRLLCCATAVRQRRLLCDRERGRVRTNHCRSRRSIIGVPASLSCTSSLSCMPSCVQEVILTLIGNTRVFLSRKSDRWQILQSRRSAAPNRNEHDPDQRHDVDVVRDNNQTIGPSLGGLVTANLGRKKLC